MLVAPNCVIVKSVGWRRRRHMIIDRIVPSNIDYWSPVIVIANEESGNREGDLVLQAFRRMLNPVQVYSIFILIAVFAFNCGNRL